MTRKRGASSSRASTKTGKNSVEHAKEIAMIVGIAMLSALFLGLLVDAVYESPGWEDFCDKGRYDETRPKPVKFDAEICGKYEQTEEELTCYEDDGNPRFTYDENGCQVFDYCDVCGVEFEDAREIYNRNVFFIITPVGILFIILGIFWSIEFMGTGFMFGGIFSIFYSTARYFGDMSKILRVIVIGIYLLIILLLGYVRLVKKEPLRDIIDRLLSRKYKKSNNKL